MAMICRATYSDNHFDISESRLMSRISDLINMIIDMHSKGSPWVVKISCVSQVRELRTPYRVPTFLFFLIIVVFVGIRCLSGPG